jgi:hypothetical protein
MTGRLAFNLLLLAFAAYFVWSAPEYEPKARLIPLVLGLLVFIVQGCVTLKEAMATEPPAPQEGHEPPPADELRRVATLSGWMVLFFALFLLFGTLSAIFLFILLFLGLRRDVPKWMALAIAGGMSLAVWVLFVYLMRFQLYPGVLFGGTLPPL